MILAVDLVRNTRLRIPRRDRRTTNRRAFPETAAREIADRRRMSRMAMAMCRKRDPRPPVPKRLTPLRARRLHPLQPVAHQPQDAAFEIDEFDASKSACALSCRARIEAVIVPALAAAASQVLYGQVAFSASSTRGRSSWRSPRGDPRGAYVGRKRVPEQLHLRIDLAARAPSGQDDTGPDGDLGRDDTAGIRLLGVADAGGEAHLRGAGMPQPRGLHRRSAPVQLGLDLIERAAADGEIAVGLDEHRRPGGKRHGQQDKNTEQGTFHHVASARTLL